MRLYHGTNGKHIDSVLKNGIRPRGRRKGNYSHSVESNPNAVYLTDTYALFFAAQASDDDMHGAIFEIETDALNQFNLNADEDVLEQAGRKYDDLPKDWSMEKRTKWYRKRLNDFRYPWDTSLKGMGTCCYMDTIPREAITRVISLDFKKLEHLYFQALDMQVSLMNFHILKDRHQRILRWLLNEHSEEDLPQLLKLPHHDDPTKFTEFREFYIPETRDGVTIMETVLR